MFVQRRSHGQKGLGPSSLAGQQKGINPYTIRVMEKAGIPLDGHRSKPLTEYMGHADLDYLITVCDDADENCPFFPGMGQRLHWGFEDPAALLAQKRRP